MAGCRAAKFRQARLAPYCLDSIENILRNCLEVEVPGIDSPMKYATGNNIKPKDSSLVRVAESQAQPAI